jgi:NADH-quinone oxidoreductase subunit C
MKSINDIKSIIEKNSNFSFLTILFQNDNLVCLCKAENIIENIVLLKKHPELKFRQLVDILAVDYPGQEKRFEVIYLLLSHENNLRVTIKLQVEDKESIQTLTNIFPSANWLEREVFDMHGIPFDKHPDLRRILTDYDFEGFPLRKDFPLTGYKEVRYDPEKKKSYIWTCKASTSV